MTRARSLSRALAATALAAALAGCAGSGVSRVWGRSYFAPYNIATFSAFAASGPVVEIRGAPPGGAGPEAAAEALRLPGWWPQTPFRLSDAPPGSTDGSRIVLVFGAQGGVDPIALCRGGGPEGGARETLTVQAAYCVGSRAGSGAVLEAGRRLGPGDAEFSREMIRLMDAIAPRSDPLERNRRDGPIWLLGR
mgnify:CR=1 FL=1